MSRPSSRSPCFSASPGDGFQSGCGASSALSSASARRRHSTWCQSSPDDPISGTSWRTAWEPGSELSSPRHFPAIGAQRHLAKATGRASHGSEMRPSKRGSVGASPSPVTGPSANAISDATHPRSRRGRPERPSHHRPGEHLNGPLRATLRHPFRATPSGSAPFTNSEAEVPAPVHRQPSSASPVHDETPESYCNKATTSD